MEKENSSPWQQLDYTLLFIIFLFLCVSMISIYVAPHGGSSFAIRQFFYYLVGGVAIAAIMLIDFDRFRHIAWYLYGIGILLLVPLTLVGLQGPPDCNPCGFIVTNNGATSWYNIPGAGTIQPSEFMKIFLILALSHVISRHYEIYPHKTLQDDLRLLGKIIIVSIIPMGMVAVQPDLGTAMILAFIMLSMLLISGIRWRIIVAVVLLGILFIGFNILLFIFFPEHALLQGYQMDRINAWLHPAQNASDDAYQLMKSLGAVGSGELYGTGIGNQNLILPEDYTDFIFSVIAKDFGFLGASIVISLYFLLIYRIIHSALEIHDRFGSYLCAGVIGMFTFQVFQNIGMTIQVMPITGIPLPFISYGGSSLLTSMIAVGIVLNVRSRKRTYMFD
ncbi:MAG TPA: FtsW/RodA/SpoVE family cell cycle protein [Bacillales bacterium]|nr:FtsW/RodA/SpoVE family cell cycle protein [Bacillales bacterium]